MDKKLSEAIEEFVNQRMNDYGERESRTLREAYSDFEACCKKLIVTLSKEQKELFDDCDNSYRLLDGATMHFYYTGGFNDAIHFLMGWGEVNRNA